MYNSGRGCHLSACFIYSRACCDIYFVKKFTKLKQRDSLPLDAATEARGSSELQKSPSVVQGQSSGNGSGGRLPQKLKLFAHLHIIF